jgi:hypothetical protein
VFVPLYAYQAGSMYALRRAGVTVVTPDGLGGSAYAPGGRDVDLVLRFQRAGETLPRSARVLKRIPPPPEDPADPTVVVTLSPAP